MTVDISSGGPISSNLGVSVFAATADVSTGAMATGNVLVVYTIN